MSKIVLVLKEAKPGLKIFHPEVQLVCRSMGVNYQESKKIFEEAGVIYRSELFLNDHVAVDEELIEFLGELEELKIDPVIYEVDYKESWDTIKLNNKDIISKQMLLNILDEARGNYA